VFNIEHVFMKALYIGWHHDLAADDAGLIDAAFFGHCRLRSWIT
jgi:hypothetical protein